MASKRTENIVIGSVAAVVLAGVVSGFVEGRWEQKPVAPPLVTDMSEPEPTSMMGNRALPLPAVTDNHRSYYEDALASQAKADVSTAGSEAAAQRRREIEGMTQAAREAGYDDATARKLGSDAAALCNGDPECLR